MPPPVILGQFEGPLVLVEHINRTEIDVDIIGVQAKFEMENHRDLPHSTSTSTSTSELIGASFMPPHLFNAT